jgi:putative ABC transport system permease protein
VEEALGRLGRPGAVEAAAANFVPAAGAELPREPLEIDGQAASSDVAPSAGVISADPSFFRTMGIPLKRGRFFDASDRENSLPVAIVDEKTVEKWFGQKDPIGARVTIFGDVRAVVGVVGNVRAFHLNVAPAPIVYLPYGQHPSAAVAFVLRTGTDASGAVALARRELAAVDRDQVVRGGDAYAALIARSLGGFNLSSALAVVLAAIALAVSAVGLYSVMSFWVVRRTRETAIRVALGASPRRVVAEIVARGLRLTAGGATVGLMLALVVGKLLSFRLRQVQAFDPVLLGAVLLIVLAVAVIASILPARRAAALDPMAAIRTE